MAELGPCPPLAGTPGMSPAVTAPQATAPIHDFAGSLLRRGWQPEARSLPLRYQLLHPVRGDRGRGRTGLVGVTVSERAFPSWMSAPVEERPALIAVIPSRLIGALPECPGHQRHCIDSGTAHPVSREALVISEVNFP